VAKHGSSLCSPCANGIPPRCEAQAPNRARRIPIWIGVLRSERSVCEDRRIMFEAIVLMSGLLIVLLPRLMFAADRSPRETHHAWLIRAP
jgi:hypothetical protein